MSVEPSRLRFQDLALGYNGRAAVHRLSGEVTSGSLLAIVGENGSGKSTLLKGISGLLKPLSGSISRSPDTRLAYLAQRSELDLTFPASVGDLVSLGLWPRRGLLGRHSRQDREHVSDALSAVGLAGFERHSIGTVSGGQLQRALFARAMVQDANLILLDEPFNAVDSRTVDDLVAVIKNWHAEGRTVILVAHDLDLVRRHVPETLMLARRPVAWGPTAQVLTADRLSEARHLDAARHENSPDATVERMSREDHRHQRVA